MAVLECDRELLKTVPLIRAVAAAIVDSFEDIGKVQQVYSHWATRKLKELTRQTLKTGTRRVTLLVNKNTNSATLPLDFGTEKFVGIIDKRGYKVPLKANNRIVDSKNIDEIPCEDRCEICNQDKAICEDLTITEESTLVLVNGITATQTVIKKLYPDGNYYLETRIPVWDVETEGIIFTTTKEFVTALDLRPCGCIDDTEENAQKIQCLCPDVWCTYYAPCDNNCLVDYGGYRIFEDRGLIYFDKTTQFNRVYIEYEGFLTKKNGQYHVPEVAFETIVEWIKFKNIDGKKGPNTDKRWRYDMYRNARGNMEKEMGRIDLSQIIQTIGLTPKFDIDYNFEDWCSGSCVSYATVVGACTPATTTASTIDSCTTDPVPAQDCPCPPPQKIKTPFQLAVIAGVGAGPTVGVNTYTNSVLKDALDVNMIIVNNTNETEKALQFTFDNTLPLLSRYQGDGVTQNKWQSGDVLIINYAKII